MATDIIAQGLALKAQQPAALDAMNTQAMQPWYAAIANRNVTPAKMVMIGDSVTEWAKATDRTKRHPAVLRDLIRARYPTSGIGTGGGEGFLAPYFVSGDIQPYTTISGVTPGTDNSFGLGRRAAVISNVGQGYTYTVTGTRVDVNYVKGPSTGVLSVEIDGGAATTIDTVGSLVDGNVRSFTGLSATSHTIKVTKASGGTCYFTGLTVFNGDESKGIHVHEAGHYGFQSSSWITSSTYWPAAVAVYQPQCVTIALGLNDYQAGIAPATFKSNLQTLIGQVRAVLSKPASFVLVTMFTRGDVSSPAYPWSQYVKAMYDLALADTGGVGGVSGVAVCDTTRRLPNPGPTGSGDPWGLISTDRVHPVDIGQATIAHVLDGFLQVE